MKIYLHIVVLFLTCSCNYFENKKIHATEDMIQEKLLHLDKSKVDKFPIFEDCETVDGNIEAEKNCFITTLSRLIHASFTENNLVLNHELDTFLIVTVEVDISGKIKIIKSEISPEIKENIPNIEQLINQSVVGLPEIKPGLKKLQSGEFVAVNTRFTIPVRVVGQLPKEDSLN